MKDSVKVFKKAVDRRSLIKGGLLASGAMTLATGLLGNSSAKAEESEGGGLGKGDVAILRFLAAAELIESDLWIQYAELGGIGDQLPVEVNSSQSMNSYQAAFSNLDGDGPQYITSNTIDEISHATFLNAFLESKTLTR